MDGILHRCLELSGESKVKETQQSFYGKFQDLKYSTTGANPGRLRKKISEFSVELPKVPPEREHGL